MKASSRRVGRPRKDDDRASARGALLDAAHELMSERSTLDVPVLEIAQRAGLNVALVNYYFGGKDALLLDLAFRHQARLSSDMQQLAAMPDGAEVKLAMHIRGMVRAFRRVPYLQRLHHRILRDMTGEEAQACAAALIQPLADFYRGLVDQGVTEGVFRPVDPMLLHFTLVGACDLLFSGGASLRYGYGVDTVSEDLADAYVEHLTGLMRQGLLVRS